MLANKRLIYILENLKSACGSGKVALASAYCAVLEGPQD